MTTRNKPAKIFIFLVILFISLGFLLPFYFMIVTSLKTGDQYLSQKILPMIPFTMENYQWAFEKQDILLNYMNNVIILVGTLIPFLLLVMTTGFGIGKIQFPGRIFSLYLISAVMILPQMVLTVPLYRELAQLKLLDSIPGLILIYLAYFGPYSAYLMTTYFRDVPDTFIEAALIDGANPWRVFWHIMAPMARPMIITVTIIASQQIWNELTFALILIRSSGKRTIMAAMALLSGQYGMETVKSMAMLLLASLPMLLIYLFFQRYIQQGVLAGGIKE
ncbi:MAG: carbohydrate ABC transporter permease [Spirochaetia bacterium]|nr:carbohydrate ABC transporter permease [Spirochaetia bacterium]